MNELELEKNWAVLIDGTQKIQHRERGWPSEIRDGSTVKKQKVQEIGLDSENLIKRGGEGAKESGERGSVGWRNEKMSWDKEKFEANKKKE